MRWDYDEETDIQTTYVSYIEGTQVKFDDRWCPGATISLYHLSRWESEGRELLYTKVDCPKEFLWTVSPSFTPLCAVEIEYWVDGYMRQEMLATEGEADEIATRAVYDTQDVAHIAVTHTLSFGTSTVWIKVNRIRRYKSAFNVDVRFCVEFGNLEECTRFLHEDMRKLEHRPVYILYRDVGVIDDIMRALSALHKDRYFARRKAARRCIPHSQFADDSQPETVLIRHRDSNRGHDRLCYLPCTLHLKASPLVESQAGIRSVTVDWGAIKNFPTRPLSSDAFHSLSSLHLNFPSSTQHDCPNHDPPSQNNTDALSFTLEATGIHGLTATNSVAQGNSITIKSERRNVQVNLAGLHGISVNINFIARDSYSGAISNSNIGGTNNVNTIRTLNPSASRSPRSALSLPHRHTLHLPEQVDLQGEVGRWTLQRVGRWVKQHVGR